MTAGYTDRFKSTVFWTRTGILLALALVFQMGGFPQPVTGPAVNAILFLAAMLIGPVGGAIIGAFTPIMAFLRGILPPPLAPVIPFIVIGNGMLVIVYVYLSRILRVGPDKTFVLRRFIALGAAALVKFFILAGAVTFLVEVPAPIAQMMTLPQLYTALAGGFIALLIHRALPL